MLLATPTIIIDAKDEVGHDVGDVTVLVDDAMVAAEIDGKAIPLDPGPHTVRLQRRATVR